MSLLLVVSIPGLLILATFGLDRLEAGLDDDTLSAEDVAAVLEQAKADCAKIGARSAKACATEEASEAAWAENNEETREVYFLGYEERVLPTPEGTPSARVFVRHTPNPEFLPTRQAHHV